MKNWEEEEEEGRIQLLRFLVAGRGFLTRATVIDVLRLRLHPFSLLVQPLLVCLEEKIICYWLDFQAQCTPY